MYLMHDYEVRMEDDLIMSVYSAIEKEANKESPRNYIGASSIGDDCERKLYYRLRYPQEAKPRKANLILAANDGHHSEAYIASLLKKIDGVELITHKDDGTQLGFEDEDFKGHIDGLIKGVPGNAEVTHIWEHKCCNDKKFNQLIRCLADNKDNALEKWDYTYYCQAVIYMHYFNIDNHYCTVASAGSRKLLSIVTKENNALALHLIEKAKRIARAKDAPIGISTNPSWYKCKWCEFVEFCHG